MEGLRLKSRALNAFQLNVDIKQQQQRNTYLFRHHARHRLLRSILRVWLPAAEVVNRQEVQYHIRARYFKRMIIRFNERQIEELNRVIILRQLLLKRHLFRLLKCHGDTVRKERLADHHRLLVVTKAWQLSIQRQRIAREKTAVALNYREKAQRHRLLSRALDSLKKHWISGVELKRAENRLEMLLVHYTARQYWPRLKKEAFRRLQIAPKITRAIKFRRYHLKRQALYCLLYTKIKTQHERNEALRKERLAQTF